MKRIKAKNFDEFFKSHMGINAWKRGVAIFQASWNPISDGDYSAKLVGAWFEIPKKSKPHVIFEFELIADKPMRLRKLIPVDSPAGISALLREYRMYGMALIHLENPKAIEHANAVLTKEQPMVELSIKTNRDGVQVIEVAETKWLGNLKKLMNEPSVLEQPPAPAKAPEVVVPPPEPEPAPETTPDPVETNLPEPSNLPETDLRPGMRIRYALQRGESTGEVKNVYEEEREVSVLDDKLGSKLLIPADAIVAVLAN